MPSASHFKRLDDRAGREIMMTFDGAPLPARDGETVAAAMMAAGCLTARRTAVSGAARGPFCMMGACFECLVEIDGEPNRQACMTLAADGMAIRPMSGARPLGQ